MRLFPQVLAVLFAFCGCYWPQPDAWVDTDESSRDLDGDGSLGRDDCDDDNPVARPGAREICDGFDNDCDGLTDEGMDTFTSYRDQDGDGFGDTAVSLRDCARTEGYVLSPGDCDDTAAGVHPGEVEICDEIDQDCDGVADDGLLLLEGHPDGDGDGYGDPGQTLVDCALPEGWIPDRSDCDDTREDVHPGATEVCDEVDQDCDGVVDDGVAMTPWYLDLDTDGYGDARAWVVSCLPPTGYVEASTDCDDTRVDVNPGASEICDARDNDCDGEVDEACAR